MNLSRLSKKFFGWIGRPLQSEHSAESKPRGPLTHVIILDGTMSSLERGQETHAGVAYRLCCEMGSSVSVFYEAGVQWRSWKATPDVMLGKGINRQIRRAYGYLASRYRPGDRIFFIGYSRGAYAVRSLAGVIDLVGLVRAEHANVRNIRTAYRHYEMWSDSDSARMFKQKFCHASTPIEMVGVWDTVKALGLRLPLLWRIAQARHSFHNHQLGKSIQNGFHALALDETRNVFEPVLWDSREEWEGKLEQVWFRGAHGDIGGQLGGFEAARPLANFSLIWMLGKAEDCGLPLPGNWRSRYFTDINAPSVGTWRGWAKIFLIRRKRTVCTHSSEFLHESVQPRDMCENQTDIGATPRLN